MLSLPLDSADPYETHFGPSSSDLSEAKRLAAENKSWRTQRAQYGKLGSAVDYVPEAEGSTVEKREKPAVRIPTLTQVLRVLTVTQVLERLWTPFQERQAKMSKGMSASPHKAPLLVLTKLRFIRCRDVAERRSDHSLIKQRLVCDTNTSGLAPVNKGSRSAPCP